MRVTSDTLSLKSLVFLMSHLRTRLRRPRRRNIDYEYLASKAIPVDINGTMALEKVVQKLLCMEEQNVVQTAPSLLIEHRTNGSPRSSGYPKSETTFDKSQTIESYSNRERKLEKCA